MQHEPIAPAYATRRERRDARPHEERVGVGEAEALELRAQIAVGPVAEDRPR